MSNIFFNMSKDGKIEQLVLKWRIENFSFCYLKNGESLNCPKFHIDTLNTFCFPVLCPRGSKERKKDFISVYLFGQLAADRARDREVSLPPVRIEILGASGKKLIEFESIRTVPRESHPPSMIRWVFKNQSLARKHVTLDAKNTTEDALTFCLYVYKSSNEQLSSWSVKTIIAVDQITFKLTGSYKDGMMNDRMERFIGRPLNELSFKVVIRNTNEAYSLIVSVLDSSISRCFMKCSLVLLNADGHETSHIFKFEQLRIEQSYNEKWELELESPLFPTELKKNKDSYVKNDSITFLCKFSYSKGNLSDFMEPLIENDASIAHASLNEDLASIFSSKQLTDLKLQVGAQEIIVHKTILAARSPVFSAMFSQNMIEAGTGTVAITDIDLKTMHLFLEFLYTDTVKKMDYEVAKSLLIVSDKYQVLSLKEKCASYLLSEVTTETVCELLSLADLVGHNHLKSVAIDFIISNSADILSSPQWLSGIKNNLTLANEVLVKLSTTFSSIISASRSDNCPPQKKIRLM